MHWKSSLPEGGRYLSIEEILMTETILNISSSIGKNRWVGNDLAIDRHAEFLMQNTKLSILTSTILATRNVAADNAEDYLNPKIKELMPDPCKLTDLRKGTKRLLDAVNKNQQIAIYSDFDVDGTTSAALLILWLKEHGSEPTLYIPDRIKEGYGPNIAAFKKLASENSVIVCLDSGTQSHEPIEVAQSNNCDVIVIDHHQTSTILPKSFAIINPKRINENPDFFNLCTAGLVFLFLTDLNRLLREQREVKFDLIEHVDLVALATMADVVPLKGLNRAFVAQGVKVISKSMRPCFLSLAEKAHFKAPITAEALAFTFAPRINAAGRINDAKLATKILISDTIASAQQYANELEILNDKRKQLEKDVLGAALEQAEIENESGEPILWTHGKNWHAGVIGIVAARIKEKYKKPSIVISISEKGIGTGSARSTKNFDIGSSLLKLKDKDLIISGGGHKMAAGLKIDSNKISIAKKALLDTYDRSKMTEPNDLQINAIASTSAVTTDALEEINRAGPFGSESPKPLIAFPNCRLTHIRILDEKHVRIRFSNDSDYLLEGIMFNALQSDIGQYLIATKERKLHIAGYIELNEWAGRKKPNVIIIDIAPINFN